MRLIHDPENPDARLRLHVDVEEEGCLYTLRDGVLVCHGCFRDGSIGEGGEVTLDLIEEETVPHLRQIELLLRCAERNLAESERLLAEFMRWDGR